MKNLRLLTIIAFVLATSTLVHSQCNQSLTVHEYSAQCNGNGTSTVRVLTTIIFGDGNNSVALSYNTGSSDINAVVIDDDNGDVINGLYEFNVPTCDYFTVKLSAWSSPLGSGSECDDPEPIIMGIVLPVTYGEFNIINHDNKVELEWNTYSEINNEKFVIQRSKDGKSFYDIGELKGAGESTEETWYNYYDEDPINGNGYYRLVQMDYDGTRAFSEIRSVKVDLKNSISIYPNPSSEFIIIASQTVDQYKIFSIDGELVLEASKNNNSDDLKIDISVLENGIFILKGLNTNTSETFIKL